MKLERDVIIDLLPAYFSGEASAATRALVENYFREDPEFEKFARLASGPLESLKVPLAGPDPEREKLALERARLVSETRNSFLALAAFFTLILFLFRVVDGKIVWILWSGSPTRGILFTALATFMWLMFFYVRRRKDPLPSHTKFLWMALFYTVLPFLFTVRNHKIVWLFEPEPDVAYLMGAVAVGLWIMYFIQRWKYKGMEL